MANCYRLLYRRLYHCPHNLHNSMVRRRPQEFQRPACGFRGAAARYPCWGSERGGKGCGRQGRLKRGLIGVECWRSWWGGGGEEMEGNRCGHKKDAGECVYRYANITAYFIPSQIDRLPFYSFPLISRPHIPYQSITNPSVSYLKNLMTVFLNMTLCKIAQYIHFTR